MNVFGIRDKPGHRKFIYPVIAAVTGPILTFAPPAFFGTYSKNWPLPRSIVRPFAHTKNRLLAKTCDRLILESQLAPGLDTGLHGCPLANIIFTQPDAVMRSMGALERPG